jgi:hypothetical protein
LTAGFDSDEPSERASARFLDQGFSLDSQLAEATDEKEAKAPS